MRLNSKVRLCRAKTSKSASRWIVGVEHVAIYFDVRYVVRPGSMGSSAGHDVIAQRGIGSRVTQDVSLHSYQATTVGDASLEPDDRSVSLGVGNEGFLASVGQLDGPASGLSQQRGMDLPGDVLLATKSATDGHVDHSHFLLRHSQAGCNLSPVGKRDLRTNVDSNAAILIGAGHATLRLQKDVIAHWRLIDLSKDDIGLGKAFLGAPLPYLNVFQYVAAFGFLVHAGGVGFQRRDDRIYDG